MKRFNDEVYGILNAAEAHGMIGDSATAKKYWPQPKSIISPAVSRTKKKLRRS
ncbi:hypothetical protein AB1Y45_20370 [Morganella morganii]|uniref:hypothetical protein n=1 Tax=Morganella morganii TaxID=582 RepID=UPI001AD89EE0|nr:hypothetical protein [Morganella morganii]MBO8066136.1 hypothetical protein [Morganella morganii]